MGTPFLDWGNGKWQQLKDNNHSPGCEMGTHEEASRFPSGEKRQHMTLAVWPSST